MDARAEIRDFLTSRRARITPQQAGLPDYGGKRRVLGLRRSELATLAGISVEYLTQLERGDVAGASESVLDALARALQLDEAERTHLFDLARAASGPRRTSGRSRAAHVRPSVQRILDTLGSPAYARTGRGDIVAMNTLCTALYGDILRPEALPLNVPRLVFLDPRSHDFFLDWEIVADDAVAALRIEAAAHPPTGSCPTSSANSPPVATPSRRGGANTTSGCTAPPRSGCTTPSSATSNSPVTPWRYPARNSPSSSTPQPPTARHKRSSTSSPGGPAKCHPRGSLSCLPSACLGAESARPSGCRAVLARLLRTPASSADASRPRGARRPGELVEEDWSPLAARGWLPVPRRRRPIVKLDKKVIAELAVEPGKPAALSRRSTVSTKTDWLGTAGRDSSKDVAERCLQAFTQELASAQELLYADATWSLLVVFQALDAAGKDGTIRHVMSGVNPQGCEVYSFKQPSAEDLEHDFLWRCAKVLPERGRIGIFNRSYYEEVLVVRVHPELLAAQRLPDGGKQGDALWQQRYEDINAFERHLARGGTRIVKFFLHVSKDEQRRRFLDRLDEPDKQWKFSTADLAERAHFEEYQQAYEQALTATSTPWAPWYVVPADNKPAMRALVGGVIVDTIEQLGLRPPTVDPQQAAALAVARDALLREPDADESTTPPDPKKPGATKPTPKKPSSSKSSSSKSSSSKSSSKKSSSKKSK